jgi:hypothetical protein
MGKCGLSSFSSSRVQFTVEGNIQLFAIAVRTFLLTNLGIRFLLRGEGYDTPSVIVAAAMFL